MASIRKEFAVDAAADRVWAAVRDFGAVDRLAPGFVREARLEGDVRIVTFASGTVARERLVDCDDRQRRLVYAIASERLTHYSASLQVSAAADGARLVWIVDLLPNELAAAVSAQMDLGVAAMQSVWQQRA